MTIAETVVRPFVAVSLAVSVAASLLACGGADPEPAVSTKTDERPITAGAAVYATGALMCVLCHGRDGEGTMMGPGLDGLENDWNESDLASFLLDPVAWLPKSARLNEIHSRYPQGMPQPSGLSADDAALMARWLLAGRPR